LNEQVLLLSKKHGQLKQAITKMVQVVMGFLDDAPSMEKKMQTIETLRTVTEGKVGRQSLAIVRHTYLMPDICRG
jgi:26S proteasome regulatory subunit N5